MKAVGFGDFLIHFSPMDKMRFHQADAMQMSFTGAEANVCAALGFWGIDTEFVTKIPEHALAVKGVSFLKSNSVGVKNIVYGKGRMGVYFLEIGHDIRPSQVIYDREGTVFANSSYEDYGWDNILCGADMFYLSGITPSLSESLFECCKAVLAECKKRNIITVFDVNLRPAICNTERSREIFGALSPYIDCLISNEEHLKQLLDYKPAAEDESRLAELIDKTRKKTGIEKIAITVRRTPTASEAVISAAYFNGDEFATSMTRKISVVDRVGSGDAFSAGLVYSMINNFGAKDAVEFAVASSALKHTIHNDINFSAVREIQTLVNSSSCDVRR